MPEHDLPSSDCHNPGRLDKRLFPQAQKLGSHVIGNRDPTETTVDSTEKTETPSIDRAEKDHDKKKGHGFPNLGQSLPEHIDLAAEVTLHCPEENPDQVGDDGQADAKYQRRARRIQNPHTHVSPTIVEAQPVPFNGTKREFHCFAFKLHTDFSVRTAHCKILLRHNQRFFGSRQNSRPRLISQSFPC